MTKYILPLEVLGLVLTAALIGAVIIAMREKTPAEPIRPEPNSRASRNGEAPQNHGEQSNTSELRLDVRQGQTSEVSS